MDVYITRHAFFRAYERLDVPPELSEREFKVWFKGLVLAALREGKDGPPGKIPGSLQIFHCGRGFLFTFDEKQQCPRLITAYTGSLKRRRSRRNARKHKPGKLPPRTGRSKQQAARCRAMQRSTP